MPTILNYFRKKKIFLIFKKYFINNKKYFNNNLIKII